MSAGKVRAQRVFVEPLDDGTFSNIPIAFAPDARRHLPVLVIPESAVRGCKHPACDDDPYKDWCPDCGAHWTGTRWIKPCILRVAKERTK